MCAIFYVVLWSLGLVDTPCDAAVITFILLIEFAEMAFIKAVM